MIRWHPAQRLGLDRAAVASVLSLLAMGCGGRYLAQFSR
jgi:hypothetical protein